MKHYSKSNFRIYLQKKHIWLLLGVMHLLTEAAVAGTPAKDSLQQILQKPQVPFTQQVQTLAALAEWYLPIHSDSAAWYAQKGVSLARAQQYALGEAICLNRLGEAYLVQGAYADARKTGEQARTLALRQHSAYEVAFATNLIGKSIRKQGNYALAFQYFLTYRKLCEELGDSSGLSKALNNLGIIYREQKNYKMALEYLHTSLQMQQRMQKPPMIITTLANLGSVYLLQKNDSLSLYYFTQTLNAVRKTTNLLQLSHAYHGLARTYYMKKQYDLCFQYYAKAMKLVEKLNDKSEIVRYDTEIAEIYLESGHFAEAEKVALQTVPLAQSMQSTKELQRLYFTLGAIAEHKNNFQQALAYIKRAHTLKDSLYNIVNTRIIKDMAFNASLEKQKLEIKALNKDKIIQQEEIYQKKWQRNASIIGIILAAGFIFSLVRNNRYQKHVNTLLETQSAEIAEKNHKLAENNSKLEELNTVKTRLFSIISHDIRSPLRLLLGVLSLLEDEQLSKNELQMITQKLQSNLIHLSDFLDNLLTWARSQMNAVAIEPAVVPLSFLINDNLALLHPIAEKKSIRIQSAIESHIHVLADRESVNIILRNLLANAIKFTPEGGQVTLSTALSDQHVTIAIQDTGVGISQENLQQLFGQGALSTNGTDNEKGTGLGLLLCKDFVEKNGGQIWVESVLRKGTTFKFTLPRVTEGVQASS